MSSFLTDSNFKLFKDKIYHESGIHFSEINRPILESRIKERLRITNISTPETYFQFVISNKDELDTLLDAITTNLTNFFRNESHFKALDNIIIPEIASRKGSQNKKRLKIWSAGCSTGEEPYSVAISCLEKLPDPHNWQIQILASDISLKSLLIAKEGYYTSEKIVNVKPEYLEKYFDKLGNGYKVKDKIKSLIRFDFHNLKFDNGERDLDIVFCRNVIIYFDREAQIEVIQKFSLCSNEDMYLFIGHSESLFGMNTDFKFHKLGDACVYRKK